MLKRKNILRMLGLCLALCAGLLLLQSAVAGSATGKITRLKGSVQIKYGKAEFKKIKKGAAIKSGVTIKTGRKSRVEIRLADNSVIRLGSKSSMTLNKALFTGEGTKKVNARLWGGKAYAVVNKLTGDDSSFQIKTTTAVAGVRGTAFRINANRDKSTVVRVYTGAVAVSNAPIYAKAGKPKSGGKFQLPRQGVKPGGPGRTVVAGPSKISKKEWEEMVASAMQEIRVSGTGKLSAPVAFDAQKDLEDDWVAWNKTLDKDLEH
jgi:hypothetical protein